MKITPLDENGREQFIPFDLAQQGGGEVFAQLHDCGQLG